MPPRVRLHDWGAPLNTWRTTRKPASAGLGARARDQAGQREPEILGLEYPRAGGDSGREVERMWGRQAPREWARRRSKKSWLFSSFLGFPGA